MTLEPKPKGRVQRETRIKAARSEALFPIEASTVRAIASRCASSASTIEATIAVSHRTASTDSPRALPVEEPYDGGMRDLLGGR